MPTTSPCGSKYALPDEPGLFTCTWPKSPYMAQGVRYRSEVWTGIEYQVASHLIYRGFIDEGLSIVERARASLRMVPKSDA